MTEADEHGRENLSDSPEGQTQSGTMVDQVIPIKNPVALLSYYFGVFALIPLMGAFFGLASVPMGIIGLKNVANTPGLPGKAHAWAGIIIGSISVLAHVVGLTMLLKALAK